MDSVAQKMSLEDGVYFGLPEDDYHADDALGSTDVKNLITGPEIYWANTPMNPLHERKETKETMRGTAYHKLILEGEQAYNDTYAVEPDKADYPNALFTMEDLRDALKGYELPVSGRKSDLIDRLLEHDPKAQIWDAIIDEFRGAHEDKKPISKKLDAEIRYASRFIFANPHLKDAFQGGYPEVSIIYTDGGLRRKARVDYLKPTVAIDLKSYSNPFGARADVAIHTAAARMGHDIQAAWYRPAFAAAKSLPWFVMNGVDLADNWERTYRNAPETQFYFVYQATDKVPMARGRWMDYRLQTFQIAELQCANAVQTYLQCREEFGVDPWIIPEKPTAFEDEGFPMFRR